MSIEALAAEVRRTEQACNRMFAEATQSIRGGALTAIIDRAGDWREAFAANDAAVAAYNTAVKAHNATIEATRQARRNAAEVKATRAAACTRCYSTHPGEC